VGYLEEEAVHSYSEYLAGVENGTCANVAAPEIAIAYWKLAADARLREIIIAVRADECLHRDVNHGYANELDRAAHTWFFTLACCQNYCDVALQFIPLF
jgi:ubiquinol oxidase